MGFRTVVALNNDESHLWQHDPDLGDKIWSASCEWWHKRQSAHYFQYGNIIEQVHADTQSLIVTEHYSGTVLTGTHWYRSQTPEDRNLELLKAFADKLGYRVVKKSVKKEINDHT